MHIEIDGKRVAARAGEMLIEVADKHDIHIPRFCYHPKLSIAANCRMCLVEVEKAPKPLPACATPVSEGMVVHTQSATTIEAQKGVMEFLLINHPLDCPICDQGGECELQDLAMGYGSDISRYQEKKRVVQDKNIGSLIQTDMTRCIHCTRCVRFGEEIAGLRELGATGRGEHMEIGTYVARSMVSELSGNVIDLCPVGALTSKPYRYSARAWELREKKGIAPHDAVGSHLYIHCKGNTVRRVVPAPCESINEIWLSDRDRFSYQGLHSAERLQYPQYKKQDGGWELLDWQEVLDYTGQRLQQYDATDMGVLAHATEPLEGLYALQKLARGLHCHNIDHRVGQRDFRGQVQAPIFPALGQSIAALDTQQAVLLIGSRLRKEQPILNHRLRQAVIRNSARVALLDVLDQDVNYPLSGKWICPPRKLLYPLLGMLKLTGETLPADVADTIQPDALCHQMLTNLQEADAGHGLILLGNLAQAHPQFSLLYQLASRLAQRTACQLACPGPHANSAGAHLMGVLPHRLPGGRTTEKIGLHAWEQFASPRRVYLLMGLEPELDCWDGAQARAALQDADLVVALTAFASESMREYADVLLPITAFTEHTGQFINCEARVQAVEAAVQPPGEAQPAWQALQGLAGSLQIDAMDWQDVSALQEEIRAQTGLDALPGDAITQSVEHNEGRVLLHDIDLQDDAQTVGQGGEPPTTEHYSKPPLYRIAACPMNATDGLVRRANALQEGADCADGAVHLNRHTAQAQGLATGDFVYCQQQGEIVLPVRIDNHVPDQCVLIYTAQAAHSVLGASFGTIHLRPRYEPLQD